MRKPHAADIKCILLLHITTYAVIMLPHAQDLDLEINGHSFLYKGLLGACSMLPAIRTEQTRDVILSRG